MNRADFFESAGELSLCVEQLYQQTESSLLHAENELCHYRRPLPAQLLSRAVIALEMGRIGDQIEEVMYAYNLLCQAAGLGARHELAYRLLAAPRHVQRKVRQVLERNSAALLSRSPGEATHDDKK